MGELRAVDIMKRPALTDIPGRLRQLADDYESGREATPEGILIIEHPIICLPASFGKAITMAEAIGVLFMTCHSLNEASANNSSII